MKRIYKIVGRFFTIIMSLIILVITFYPSNGGPTINLPGGIAIHADPPRKKLIQYMNDKYGVNFYEAGDDFTPDKGHPSKYVWEDGSNGIIVYTYAFPNHYFYVRSYLGKYYDDYALHLVEQEAEAKLHDMIKDSIDSDFVVVCPPLTLQPRDLDTDVTADVFLKESNYRIEIYVGGNGDNKDMEAVELKKALTRCLSAGEIKTYGFSIYYCDEKYLEQINSLDQSTIDGISDHIYWSGSCLYGVDVGEENQWMTEDFHWTNF